MSLNLIKTNQTIFQESVSSFSDFEAQFKIMLQNCQNLNTSILLVHAKTFWWKMCKQKLEIIANTQKTKQK